ncbi:MAG: flagellar assembly protein FliW [Firmicutes bacterium]|nr:flagellar assembly protein FliW [Bacillota bacterium]
MKVVSSRFGTYEIPEEKIIAFPEGILGFEDEKRYVILEDGADSPFKWLHAVDDPDLAFIIIDPRLFYPSYEIVLSKDDGEKLSLQNPEDAVVYVIVVIPEDPSQMTANLQAPLVINSQNRIGRQVVLSDNRYSLKHKILPRAKSSQTAPSGGRRKGQGAGQGGKVRAADAGMAVRMAR